MSLLSVCNKVMDSNYTYLLTCVFTLCVVICTINTVSDIEMPHEPPMYQYHLEADFESSEAPSLPQYVEEDDISAETVDVPVAFTLGTASTLKN